MNQWRGFVELTQRKLKSVAFIMSYHSRYYSDPHVHVTQWVFREVTSCRVFFARHRNCSLNILAKKTCWQKFFRRSFKISLTNVSLVFPKSFSKTGIRTSFLWDETNSYGKAVNIFLLPCQAWVHLKIPLTEKFMCSIFSFLSMQCLIYFQLWVWWRNE